MLKVGRKGLYLSDNDDGYYKVSPPCVLDFYVHESRQRNGLGKHLFEHMLKVRQHPQAKPLITLFLGGWWSSISLLFYY